jgi:acetylornithine/N-succinyldiaminopimelate aminotransferase
MKTKKAQDLEKKYVMQTYAKFPVLFTKGKGVKLISVEGKEYLDLLSAISVTSLGHCHPKVVCAIRNQARKLIQTSNLYYTIPQIKLAEMLAKLSGLDKVFFTNSGAEANEAAIKLARKYSRDNFGAERYEIISMHGAFHGRTLGSLSATPKEKIQKDFEPLVPGFKYVKFNDIQELKSAVNEKTCAIMLEAIQGESGVNPVNDEYLKAVRALCTEKNILLIMDEIQCGLGRTGKMFAYEHYGVKPDIVTVSKSLANGLPLGACIASDKAAMSFSAGTHGTTFGGGNVICAAAIAVLNEIKKAKILGNVTEMGAYFMEKLNGLKAKYSFLKEVRGKGLMIGVELTINGRDIVTGMLNEGVIINCTNDTVLRFLPPFIITKKHIDHAVKALDMILEKLPQGGK